MLGFALSAAIWWCYFDRDDERGQQALARVDQDARARLALYAYSYAHWIMIAGIVAVAAGVQGVIADVVGIVTNAVAWSLAAGIALYLLGDVWFRSQLRIGEARVRLVTAAIALATAAIGMALGSLLQLALLVVLLVSMLVLERWLEADAAAPPK